MSLHSASLSKSSLSTVNICWVTVLVKRLHPLVKNMFSISWQSGASMKSHIWLNVLRLDWNSRLPGCTCSFQVYVNFGPQLWMTSDWRWSPSAVLIPVTVLSVHMSDSAHEEDAAVVSQCDHERAASPHHLSLWTGRTDRESDRKTQETQWRHPSHQLCVCFSFISACSRSWFRPPPDVVLKLLSLTVKLSVFSCRSRLKGTSEPAENHFSPPAAALTHSHSHFDLTSTYSSQPLIRHTSADDVLL